MDSNSQNKIDKAENEISNTKEEVFEPKEEVLVSTEELLAPTEEVLVPKEDKPKQSLTSVIKNLLSTNNKPIHLKDEEVINEKLVDEEKTNNKITQTLDVLLEEIETRKEKTFVERIFSFMLRRCSA